MNAFEYKNFNSKEYDEQTIDKQQILVDLVKEGIGKVFSEPNKYDDITLHKVLEVAVDEFDTLKRRIEAFEEKWGTDNESQQ